MEKELEELAKNANSLLDQIIEKKAEMFVEAERRKDGVAEDCFIEIYKALAKGYKQGILDTLQELK